MGREKIWSIVFLDRQDLEEEFDQFKDLVFDFEEFIEDLQFDLERIAKEVAQSVGWDSGVYWHTKDGRNRTWLVARRFWEGKGGEYLREVHEVLTAAQSDPDF